MSIGKQLLGVVVTALLGLPVIVAQTSGPTGPKVGKAIRHDISKRIGEMEQAAVPPTQFRREIPLRKPPDLGRPADTPGPPDPARQTETRPLPGLASTPAPLLNVEGLNDDDNASIIGGRIVPPDTEGDVGVNYYVQWINLIFAVYSKDGTDCADGSATPGCIATGGGPFAGNRLWSGFGGFCETNNDGDPIVLYDHLAGRWFFSQFSINQGIQCVALSQGGDPRGPYDRWEFVVSPGQNNDFPKFGLMPDAYYLSLRDFPSGATFASAVAFDRAAMLVGAASPTFVKFGLPCLAGNCPDGIEPPHLEGPAPPPGTPGFFTRAWDDDFDGPLTGADGYRVWKFVPDFVTPASSTFSEEPFVVGSPFDSTMCGFFQRNCIVQPSPGERLDPVDELQMYRAQFRHFADRDSIVLNTTVDATGTNVAGVRWAELRDTGSGWFLHQDGTYAPADGENRWLGSAAMDGSGGIALGFSVSSSSTFPSIRYTSRTAADPLGMLPGGEVELIAGSDVQTSSFNRWGDYSALSVDPTDDCTFWYTQEYQADDLDGRTDFDFKTRIGSFKLPSCGPAVCGDGICGPGEDCFGCPADCELTVPGVGQCGNGICEAGDGEDCVTCPTDCNGKQFGRPSRQFCCGFGGTNPVGCADSRCTTGGFQCTEVPGPPVTVCCGDSSCDPSGAECDACGQDCVGDPICEPACVPTARQERGPRRCSDGLDNDCDGLIDGADPGCQ
ncbi:MAG: hypothetical protein ACE5JX_19585 [Acidobacteriota bacterium]